MVAMEISYPCCEHCIDEDGYGCRGDDNHTEPCAHGCDDDMIPADDSDDDGLTDVEADHMTLVSAGWGTDEDYGYYGESEFDYFDGGYGE